VKCVCNGVGFYRDRRCTDYICDHRRRKVVGTCTKDGKKTPVHGGRIMSCPRRPCRCPKGTVYRGDLKRRIELQTHRLALHEASA